MVLESSASDAAQQNDDDDARNYPPPAAVPIMPGFSEAGKQFFIDSHLSFAKRKFGFEPTPLEHKALAHQYGGLYVAEARGARDGLLAGMAVAYLLTRGRRRPGFIFRALGRMMPLSPADSPQARQLQQFLLVTSQATNFAIISMLGSMCGMTTYGTKGISHLARTQYTDPTVRRYVELRNRWADTRENKNRVGPSPPRHLPSHPGGGNGEADEQSLGGLDYYGDNGPPAVDATTSPTITSTTAAAAATAAEDLFFGDDQAEERAQAPAEAAGPVRSWRDRLPSRAGRAEGGGSAWDRIRRGEQSASHPDRRDDGDRSGPPSPPSSWPRRPAMKGFETQQQEEQPSPTPKGDSFTFSRSDRDRLLAKEDAQREFDERVERERRGEGLDGFVNER